MRVGDDRDLRRSRVAVDSDVGRNLALRFGYIRVAGTDDHIDRIDGFGSVRQRRDRLRTADAVDDVDTGQLRRREDGVVDGPVGPRRRAQHDLGNARDPRGEGSHQDRRCEWRAAARNVTTRAVDRHEHLLDPDPGPHVHQRGARLHFVPRRDLVACQLERGSQRGVEPVERGRALRRRDLERVELVPVETVRVLAHRDVAPVPNVGDDRRHRTAHVVGGRERARERAPDIGRTAEIDTSQHGERLIVPVTLSRQPPNSTPRDKLVPVSTSSDLALLSSLGTQLDDLGTRITEMAERYGSTPDSLLANELYSAERGLIGARRALDRARGHLQNM